MKTSTKTQINTPLKVFTVVLFTIQIAIAIILFSVAAKIETNTPTDYEKMVEVFHRGKMLEGERLTNEVINPLRKDFDTALVGLAIWKKLNDERLTNEVINLMQKDLSTALLGLSIWQKENETLNANLKKEYTNTAFWQGESLDWMVAYHKARGTNRMDMGNTIAYTTKSVHGFSSGIQLEPDIRWIGTPATSGNTSAFIDPRNNRDIEFGLRPDGTVIWRKR